MKSLSFFRFWLLLILFSLGLLIPQAPLFAVDLTITATSVTMSSAGKYRTYKAGAAITAGQLVYLEAATNTLKLADCNSATAEVRKAIGFATTGGAIGAPISVCYKDSAFVVGATLTKGVVYILTVTPGGIAALADLTTGWYGQVVGIAVSTTELSFNFEGQFFRITTAM